MQFLMGLNESYNQIRGQILLIDPLPSINKVYSLLIQDESQRSIGHSFGAYVCHVFWLFLIVWHIIPPQVSSCLENRVTYSY